MTTDFRALCAELLTAVDGKNCFIDGSSVEAIDHLTTIFDRIEIALATPPPKPPTDEELLALEKKLWHEYKTISYQRDEFMYDDGFRYALRDYRAVLERWGQ